MRKEEFCIMRDNPPYWRNHREPGLERHEAFEGRTHNRQKSIEDGLVVFLTPEQHRDGKNAMHKNYEVWLELKKEAEQTWIDYYGKSKEEFRERYGRNYL